MNEPVVSTQKGKKQVVRYEENPFVAGMVIPVGKQSVKVDLMGKDKNVLVNESTGELRGTHVTTYKRVDKEQFIKLFTSNIKLTFELKSAGIKAFTVLMWSLQNNSLSKDVVPLDKFVLDDFIAAQTDVSLSIATFGRGLAELEKAKIIAKHVRQGWFFINPSFVFNGDRIAFTTIIQRGTETEQEQLENAGQKRLDV